MASTSAPSTHCAHTPRPRDSPHTSSWSQRSTPTRFSAVSQMMSPLRPSDAQKEVRSPSPSYFGMSVDAGKDHSSSSGAGLHARGNWSPPTSNVRSAAAASPRIIPLDQNPEFEAFRRQTELNGINGINGLSSARLIGFNVNSPSNTRPANKPSIPRSSPAISMGPPSPRTKAAISDRKFPEPKPRSPKRLLSSPFAHITDRPRRGSPAQFSEEEAQKAPQFLPRDSDARSSLPATRTSTPPSTSHQRSETFSVVLQGEQAGESKDEPVLATPQHVVNLLNAGSENILLLDLRVSSEFRRSRIMGALNLCIPTIVLKRPSTDLKKLADTFNPDPDQKQKFERWRTCKYIIVYDGRSALPMDAMGCLTILKKFTNEGWRGPQYIIKGGFTEFARSFPLLITHGECASGTNGISVDAQSSMPTVVGGCPMPSSATRTAANPFFGNIRQNMDLLCGVGQMTVKLPTSMAKSQEDHLPTWLQRAADRNDDGKFVAEKFLQIEKHEQKRMQEALSSNVVYGNPRPQMPNRVQLAGIEKGAKNRYNNIWPYEHSRVKLQGVCDGGCDYINANHIKAEWSNKRYIATQGPIPATFTVSIEHAFSFASKTNEPQDFWNVVWQQDVRVIVMLTAENESGQVKAHNYWESRHYGPLNLNFLSEQRASLEPSKINRHRDRPAAARRRSTNPPAGRQPSLNEVESPSSEEAYVIVRRFTLSHSAEPFVPMREIIHLQYSTWPDFGAPAHPAHLLGLVEQCDAVVRLSNGGSPSTPAPASTRPILVHCSAGCGRTGTFCTVDSVIDMMKRQRIDCGRNNRHVSPMDIKGDKQIHNDDESGDLEWLCRDDIDLIEKTVEDFRLQRLSMVQSLKQFVLCYETVLEWLAEQTPKSA